MNKLFDHCKIILFFKSLPIVIGGDVACFFKNHEKLNKKQKRNGFQNYVSNR